MRGSMMYLAILAALCASLAAAAVAKDELYCPPTNGVEDVLHPKAENCSEFYKCNYGELVTIPCPAGLLYCEANKWCDYPDNCDYSNCKISPVKEDNKEEPSNNGGQNNDNQQTEGGDQNNYGDLYCPPELEGSDILYSQPDNCNEFYQCYYGQLFQLRCQQGLYYCPTTKWCDYAENCDYAKYCKMPSSVNVPQEGNRNDKKEDVVPDTGVEQSNGEQPVNDVEKSTYGELYCPPTNDVEDVLHPKAENCSEFYKCNYGELVTIPCPAGLLYCEANKWCDYPDNCDYSNCKISPVTEYTNEVPDNKNKPEENNNNIDLQINNNNELYCPPTNDEIILYPKAENCSEFYQCSYGHLYTHVCQPGLYYCAANQWCDFLDNCDYSNCQISSSLNIPPQKNNINEQSNDAGKNSGAEQDGGVVTNENGELSCSNEGALYSNPDNCNEFYQCAAGRVFTQLCPAGLYYCGTKKACDYPDNCDYSSCRKSLIKLPPVQESKDVQVDHIEPEKGTQLEQNKNNEQKSNVAQDRGVVKNENGELSCSLDIEEALYSNPDNCNEFYQCSFGHVFVQRCAPGLYYCASKQWCDYADNCDYSSCKTA